MLQGNVGRLLFFASVTNHDHLSVWMLAPKMGHNCQHATRAECHNGGRIPIGRAACPRLSDTFNDMDSACGTKLAKNEESILELVSRQVQFPLSLGGWN
jgi:hypothetical protein